MYDGMYSRTIRSKVRYPNLDGAYGDWDCLTFDQRKFLLKCADYIDCLEQEIAELREGMQMRKVVHVFKDYTGDEFESYTVDKPSLDGSVVIDIEYHQPAGEGDAHYCDITFSDGKYKRLFRPDVVDFREV